MQVGSLVDFAAPRLCGLEHASFLLHCVLDLSRRTKIGKDETWQERQKDRDRQKIDKNLGRARTGPLSPDFVSSTGTYSRRAGSREKLSDLAQHIRGADFRNLRIPKTIAPGNGAQPIYRALIWLSKSRNEQLVTEKPR